MAQAQQDDVAIRREEDNQTVESICLWLQSMHEAWQREGTWGKVQLELLYEAGFVREVTRTPREVERFQPSPRGI